MKKTSGFPIFDNAVDSLEHGIRMYQDANYPNAHKHAVLAIYQAVELFLKDALCRVNPVLIYCDLDKRITEDSRTVGYKEAITRLGNVGVVLDEKAKPSIERLQKRRNRIEHREYKPSDDDKNYIAEALKCVYDFVPQYLKTEELSSYVDDNLWTELQTFMLDYEKLLEEAEKQVEEITGPALSDPKAFAEPPLECPRCGHDTLVIGGKDGEDYCFFCRRVVPMAQCSGCSEYFQKEMLEEVFKCPDCLRAQWERD